MAAAAPAPAPAAARRSHTNRTIRQIEGSRASFPARQPTGPAWSPLDSTGGEAASCRGRPACSGACAGDAGELVPVVPVMLVPVVPVDWCRWCLWTGVDVVPVEWTGVTGRIVHQDSTNGTCLRMGGRWRLGESEGGRGLQL